MSLDCWHDQWAGNVDGAKATLELGCFSNPNSDGVDEMHVFQLSDGRYVVVYESGCSCYDYSDAHLEILPLSAAITQYQDYKRQNGGIFTNLELLEIRSIEKEERDNEPRCKNCNS
jgi:hypothetical protein